MHNACGITNCTLRVYLSLFFVKCQDYWIDKNVDFHLYFPQSYVQISCIILAISPIELGLDIIEHKKPMNDSDKLNMHSYFNTENILHIIMMCMTITREVSPTTRNYQDY